MATFFPHSDIKIGAFRWSGVNEVVIKRSLTSLMDTATITVPGVGRIRKGTMRADGTVQLKNGEPQVKSMGTVFAKGDKVTIKLGWNGAEEVEFEGFVRRVGRGMPVVVECEGHSYEMRNNVSVTGVLKRTTVKELLEIAVGRKDAKQKYLAKPLTGITVDCRVDIPLVDVRMPVGSNGVQICDFIKELTGNNVTIFFIKPNVLYCGLPFTAYAGGKEEFGTGAAGYRPGWNCIRDNALRERIVDEPIQIIYGGKYATTNTVYTETKLKYATRKMTAMLNNIPRVKSLQQLADEAEARENYTGYEGTITAFLLPRCQPGYKATIVNKLYPEMNGDYMATATEVRFGVSGARRRVTIGARVR